MRAHTDYLWFNTRARRELVNITDRIAEIVAAAKVAEGFCLVSAMHITAGIWVNDEESGLKQDLVEWLDRLAPPGDYRHHQTGEDNADAHLKRTLIHHQVILPITKGKLIAGRRSTFIRLRETTPMITREQMNMSMVRGRLMASRVRPI